MKTSKYYQSTIHCSSCKKPIANQKISIKEGIAFCNGCNHYFPIDSKVRRKRGVINIKNASDRINIRPMKNDELMIYFRWINNYNMIRIMMASNGKYQSILDGIGYLISRTEIFITRKYLKLEHKPFGDFIPMSFYTSSQIKNITVDPVEDITEWELSTKNNHGLYVELHNKDKVLILYDLRKTTLSFIAQEIKRILEIS